CAIAADADLRQLLTRIQFEEAGHARTASFYARVFGVSDLRRLAIDTRERLVRLLALRAGAFDQVGVCPHNLSRRLLQVPRRLFACTNRTRCRRRSGATCAVSKCSGPEPLCPETQLQPQNCSSVSRAGSA